LSEVITRTGLSTALPQGGDQASPGVVPVELRRGAQHLLERQIMEARAVRGAGCRGEGEQYFGELVSPPVVHQRAAQHIFAGSNPSHPRARCGMLSTYRSVNKR